MSALEEVPVEETEVVDPQKVGLAPPFDSETGKEARAKAERYKGTRQKGVATRIREMCGNDPGRIANILYDILENTSGKERSTDRIAAARELLDRGWGKAPAFAPIEGGDPLEASDLDRAIRDIADQLVARRAHPTLDAQLVQREIEEGVRPIPDDQLP